MQTVLLVDQPTPERRRLASSTAPKHRPLDALLHYDLAGYASQLKVGVRLRDEQKDYTSEQLRFKDLAGTASLTQLQDGFSDPGFYTALTRGYAIGPVPNNSAVQAYEDAHPGEFRQTRAPAQDSLGSFYGSERVTSAYAMSTTDVGPLRVNVGLRLEATHATYLGHAFATPADSAGNATGSPTLQDVSGTKDYTDLFPSVQPRYALDPATNVRLAVTRGIARPNYPELAPNQRGQVCTGCANQPFVFLPGVLAGLGLDANWTHTSSSVLVDPESGRRAPLLRQSPDIANLYATYDRGPLSGRLGWTYNGAMIDAYGDGTPTASGDNYFYPHGQVDGSIVYNVSSNLQLPAQVLNINNAVFGFFQGTPGHELNFQREYYGQTFFLGTKIGF